MALRILVIVGILLSIGFGVVRRAESNSDEGPETEGDSVRRP